MSDEHVHSHHEIAIDMLNKSLDYQGPSSYVQLLTSAAIVHALLAIDGTLGELVTATKDLTATSVEIEMSRRNGMVRDIAEVKRIWGEHT